MKILVIGAGGREHALVWKLKQSPKTAAVFCAPGNAGIAQCATCVPIKIGDHAALIEFAKKEEIGLIVVGPDDALAAGLVDKFQAAGLRIFGPTQKAARLESSKAFAKEFMNRHGIPTARSQSFSDSAEAQKYAQSMPKPLVIKADGLALGKGVIIADSGWAAGLAIHQIMDEGKFGEAGRRVVIEECLEGVECSIHALVDGKNYILFPGAQDHKRALDNDQGLNTGGMGTFSPSKALTAELSVAVRTEVLDRFVAGLEADGLDYRGMLFPGLMITKDGLKVLEFNCRFGDPETQVLLPRLESDLVDLLEATIEGRLGKTQAQWSPKPAVCVILASGGYPGKYEVGKPITGLESVDGECLVFHAGTREEDGKLVTAGGRVLGVVGRGADLVAARERAYAAVRTIQFEGCHYRTDIATKGLST
ncbi:MAG TPA: phosphoribosylamine--glycine ligase [Chthoniobacteraceae bacterium]